MASKYKESTSFSPFCPTGTILPYLGNVEPPGWAFCYLNPNIASKTLRGSNTFGSTDGSTNTSLSTQIIHSHNASNTGNIVSATHFHAMSDWQPYGSAGNEFPNFDTTNSNNPFFGLTLTTSNPTWNSNHTVTMGNTGSGQPFSILNPYFTVHWIIKL